MHVKGVLINRSHITVFKLPYGVVFHIFLKKITDHAFAALSTPCHEQLLCHLTDVIANHRWIVM
jgi:hypothetical protein